jgi:hemerythrin-like domain-containing protein
MSSEPPSERQINIHLAPEVMAGHYANFANISHSPYEFTITFARVDHEIETGEIPGVVVSRINLSPRFMRELMEALEENYSRWAARESIQNLPEFKGAADDPPLGADEPEDEADS